MLEWTLVCKGGLQLVFIAFLARLLALPDGLFLGNLLNPVTGILQRNAVL